MSSIYKPALLKAIVKLQRHSLLCEVPLLEIADLFVELYWTQTVIFHLRQAATLAKEPEVLQKIRRTAVAANVRRLSALPYAARASLARSIVTILRVDVLKRFHSAMPSGARPLFSWSGSDHVSFTLAGAQFIRENAQSLDVIANHWWARKLEKVNLLAPAIIEKIEADGVQRRSLKWFYERVAATDNLECFDCQMDIRDERRCAKSSFLRAPRD